MSALSDKKVGEYLDQNFVCAFQRVGTFKIVGKQKQGGNVASYFCAPDGRVLHAIAGPVDGPTFLRESQWIIEIAKKAIKDADGDGGKFKIAMRTAHADKLRQEHGLTVEPITFDPPEPQKEGDALTYRDPSGQPLAPVLKPAPIDGPDVRIRDAAFNAMQEKAKSAPAPRMCSTAKAAAGSSARKAASTSSWRLIRWPRSTAFTHRSSKASSASASRPCRSRWSIHSRGTIANRIRRSELPAKKRG